MMSWTRITDLLSYRKTVYYCPYLDCDDEWEFTGLVPLGEIEATLKRHLDMCHVGWTLADIARLARSNER